MNKLNIWIKDYTYLFINGIKMFFRNSSQDNYLRNIPYTKPPVIVLSGIFSHWTFMKPLADYISSFGHPIYIVPKLGSNIGNVASSARKVRSVIEKNNLKHAIIVAHSKGGLVGKYLLVHENEEHRVQGMVSIATPFHGSSIVKLIPYKPLRELLSGSKTIHYLEKHPEENKKIVSIFPSYDNHVWHPEGSHLDGALQNIKMDIGGHHRILGDKKMWHKVVESIDKIAKL